MVPDPILEPLFKYNPLFSTAYYLINPDRFILRNVICYNITDKQLTFFNTDKGFYEV